MSTQKSTDSITIASYILTAVSLIFILQKGLLSALLSGLLVYSLVHLLTPLISKKISGNRAKVIAVAALGFLIVAILTLAIWGMTAFFTSDAGSLHTLLQKMANIIEASRSQIPSWLQEHLPDNSNDLKEMITKWLREHSVEAKSLGAETGRVFAHLLLGMIIGAMVALYDSTGKPNFLPLAAALRSRMLNLSNAFQQIVFAQVRISASNAALTAIYILIILPLAGIHLPLAKSMIAITFFAGLLPVVGNLISNTVLVVVSLSYSLHLAIGSMLFMVTIHKLEYFLNARIIGAHINARAWELLVAILVMESVFGLSGVVAAPVYYAYLKKELMDRKLV